MIKELKQIYDSQTIAAIEDMAKNRQKTSETSRSEFIEMLYYLRHTKRWRENPQYARASFDDYLRGRFMMSESKFDKERQAYICFPEATSKFGAGVVNRAISKIGTVKAGKLLTKLPKNTRLDNIDKEVMKNAPVKKEITFSGPTKPDLQAEVLRLKEIIRQKDSLIASQQCQIERLKATVMRLKGDASTGDGPKGMRLPSNVGLGQVGVSF